MHEHVIEHRPPRIAITFLLGAVALQWLAPDKMLNLYSSTILSIILGLSGFAVMIIAWRQFKTHEVAICPTDETRFLITDGIYRYTRNPMYLGIVMMLFAFATYVGTLPFYTAAVAYWMLIHHVFCQYEEGKLATAFGRDYDGYKSRVRRWM